MDPVSILAAIPKLCTAAYTLCEYADDFKRSIPERARVRNYAETILRLLKDLHKTAEIAKEAKTADAASKAWLAGVAELEKVGGPLGELQNLMDELLKIVKPADGWVEKTLHRVAWTATKKTVEDLLNKIEQVKSTIQLILGHELIQLLLDVKKDVASVGDGVQEVISNLALQQKEHEDIKLHQEVLALLSNLDFSSKQGDVFSRRQAGTGQWFLQHETFLAWLEGRSTTLWCTGIPGAGKTSMASLVISHLETRCQTENAAVVYAYLSHKEHSAQTATDIIADFVKQLVKQQPVLSKDVRQAFCQENRIKGTRPPLDKLSQLLALEVCRFSNVFVVIDALDECDNDDNRNALLNAIGTLPREHTRFFVTSRQTPGPGNSVPGSEGGAQTAQLPIHSTDEDMMLFIEERIKTTKLQQLIGNNTNLRQDTIDAVLNSAHGMFLMAQLHMNFLIGTLNVRLLYDALKNLPEQLLDDLYDETITRIKNQEHQKASLAISILYWLSYAQRPLSVPELQQALAVRLEDRDLCEDGLHDEEVMVSACLGLVTVDPENNIIRLVHYTADEYIERIRDDEFLDAPRSIANTCLTYLLFEVFNEDHSSMKEEDLRLWLAKYPFFAYAKEHWADHCCDANDKDVDELASYFLVYRPSFVGAYKDKLDRKRDQMQLHAAAKGGYTDTARRLLERGADPNARAHDSLTPLHRAAKMGKDDMVRLLLGNGSDLALEDNCGRTALHMAAAEGFVVVVQFLLGAGADASSPSGFYGQSPLHLAAANGHAEVVQVLLSAGARIDQRDDMSMEPPCDVGGDGYQRRWDVRGGGTALHRAAENRHHGVVQLLLQDGADIHAVDTFYHNGTALHHAANLCAPTVVAVLLDMGADVSRENADGMTALDLAVQGCHEEIMQLLLDGGAVFSDDADSRLAREDAPRYEQEFSLGLLSCFPFFSGF